MTLHMTIDEATVDVAWEENRSVEALRALCQNGPLTITMSMYGGFEQVGPIGQRLPSSDSQMTTQAGDIVLYAGDQIVVFYGSNSWAYTKLGHITNQSDQELTELLGNSDVTITITTTGRAMTATAIDAESIHAIKHNLQNKMTGRSSYAAPAHTFCQ